VHTGEETKARTITAIIAATVNGQRSRKKARSRRDEPPGWANRLWARSAPIARAATTPVRRRAAPTVRSSERSFTFQKGRRSRTP
jgi:hypothetical protein